MARRGKPRNRKPSDITPTAPKPDPVATFQIRSAHSTEISFQGPIPPPEILAGYEGVIEGAADRILTMAEEQSKHRKKLEEIVIRGGSRNQVVGMIFAFILSLVIVGSGALLIYNDKSLEGLSLIVADVVALAAVFLYGKNAQRKELEANRDSFTARNS